MRETCTSGTVRGEDGNILTYSAPWLRKMVRKNAYGVYFVHTFVCY
jgi:hypothetical protein